MRWLIGIIKNKKGPPSFEEFNNFQYLIELMSEYLN